MMKIQGDTNKTAFQWAVSPYDFMLKALGEPACVNMN